MNVFKKAGEGHRIWISILIVYALLLMLASLKPDLSLETPSNLEKWFRNFLHVPAYGGLTFLISMSLKVSKQSQNLIIATSIAFAYGLLIEGLQSFSPGRHPAGVDVLLNSVGILISLGLIKRIAKSQCI